jgi:hypothetical protein
VRSRQSGPRLSDGESPRNLHRSAAHAGPGSSSERVEQKFFVPPKRMSLVLALLLRTCRRADQYAEEQINSLYFDTADLDQHERSRAGEFAKDKVRIRWYGSARGPHDGSVGPKDVIQPHTIIENRNMPEARMATVPVWLELKSRRGSTSTKARAVVDVQPSCLTPQSMAAGIVPASTLLWTMADFGFFPSGRLLPIVVVSYWRRRFVEPRMGVQIALDSQIRSSTVLPGIGRREKELELPGAVVEVKGPTLDLPLCLRPLAEIGSSWTWYSKYSSSLEAHMSTMGAVSRLWPSGTMEA